MRGISPSGELRQGPGPVISGQGRHKAGSARPGASLGRRRRGRGGAGERGAGTCVVGAARACTSSERRGHCPMTQPAPAKSQSDQLRHRRDLRAGSGWARGGVGAGMLGHGEIGKGLASASSSRCGRGELGQVLAWRARPGVSDDELGQGRIAPRSSSGSGHGVDWRR
jgi:hypothetical protein